MSAPDTDAPILVGIAKAAELLDVSEGFIRQEMRAGRIDARRAGKLIKFSPEELRRWAAEETTSWEPR